MIPSRRIYIAAFGQYNAVTPPRRLFYRIGDVEAVRLQRNEEEIRLTESRLGDIEKLLSTGDIGDYEEILRLTQEAEELTRADARLLEEWEQISEELGLYEDEDSD